MSTRWKVTFYSAKVEQPTLALPAGILANFLRIVTLIEEFGLTLGPHTAPLGRGLFEIRAIGREGMARAVFCGRKAQEIIVLMTVIKKGRKISARQMATARKRMAEVRDSWLHAALNRFRRRHCIGRK